MPELPEVETVRAGLADHVLGRRIAGAVVLSDRASRRTTGGSAAIEAALSGATPTAAVRRGKFAWLTLSAPGGTSSLVIHLGMSGQMLVRGDAADSHRHLRARLSFEDGGVLDFVDQRTFGYLALEQLLPTPDGGPGGFGSDLALVPASVSHIARDLLDPLVDDAALARVMRTRRTTIKRALLDQSLVSGVGNIYADEALWRAKVHPERAVAGLAPATVRAVLGAARDVMIVALEQGGTSFDALYVNVNGASGYFDRSLNAYGQQGKPCSRCGTTIVRMSFANRGSHFCPTCQRVQGRRIGYRPPHGGER